MSNESNNRWKLQDAKNKLSELVGKALAQGPQIITRHGEEAVYVVAVSYFKKLKKPKKSLVDFLRSSPLSSTELVLNRDKSLPRDDLDL